MWMHLARDGGLVVSPNAHTVSRKPNIMDAFDKDWFDGREGEAPIVKPDAMAAIHGWRAVAAATGPS